jgi:hypothetical protein
MSYASIVPALLMTIWLAVDAKYRFALLAILISGTTVLLLGDRYMVDQFNLDPSLLVPRPAGAFDYVVDAFTFWLPLNIYVPMLNFVIDWISLTVTLRMFVRAALTNRWAYRLAFLMIDASLGAALFVVNTWLSAVLLASAAGIGNTSAKLAMDFSMMSLFIKYDFGLLGVYIIQNLRGFGAYVVFPLLAGFEHFTERSAESALLNPLVLGCALLSISSVVPTVVHLGIILFSLALKPLLIVLAVIFRQAIRVFLEDAEKFSMLLFGVLKVMLFLGVCALSFFGVWGVLAL